MILIAFISNAVIFTDSWFFYGVENCEFTHKKKVEDERKKWKKWKNETKETKETKEKTL